MSRFKIKIGFVAVGLVALLTVLLWISAIEPFASRERTEVDESVARATRLLSQAQRLYSYDLVSQAMDLATKKDFVEAIQEVGELDLRAAVFDVVDQAAKALAKQRRKPAFLGVVNEQGDIIARDGNENADYAEPLAYPVVEEVLSSGAASSTIWIMKNLMMRAAVAPIYVDDEVRGAVAIAYDFTAAQARQDSQLIGTHVAYFMDRAIRASSFTVPDDPRTEDAGKVSQLTKAFMGRTRKALATSKKSAILNVQLDGKDYRAITGPMPGPVAVVSALSSRTPIETSDEATPDKEVGYVVLMSLHKVMRPVVRARWMIVVFGLLLLLVIAGTLWAVARHFVTAEDHIELGITEIVNGNLDYTFSAEQEFEGMANALNVMLARLLGRPEPGEEEEGVGTSWQRADVIAVGELEEVDPATRQRLSEEPEADYYARIYREYVAARQAAGLPVEGLTAETLAQRLRANEAMLKAKHKCSLVRFVIHSQAGDVTFRPVRLA